MEKATENKIRVRCLLDHFVMCRQRHAMLKAIKIAAGGASITDGLRVIRRFERVNNIKFNPFSVFHINMVRGHGDDEQFFRRVNKILNT